MQELNGLCKISLNVGVKGTVKDINKGGIKTDHVRYYLMQELKGLCKILLNVGVKGTD